MKKYTKEEFLKAAEIGEVSMIDARHIVSLLEEARHILKVGFDCHECKHSFSNPVECVIKSGCDRCEELQSEVNRCYEAMDAKKGING